MVTVVTQPRPKFIACPQCQAGLEYLYTETQIAKYHVKRGDKVLYGAFRCIICPCCNHKIPTRENDISGRP